MKKFINKIIDFYHSGDNAFYFSLLGPLIMGIIHLVSCINHFDVIVVSYCAFCFLIFLFKVWQWAITKYNLKPSNLIAGIISIVVILFPMMAAFVLTILYKDSPHYLFDWLIYAYALYGTIKMVFAVKKFLYKNKNEKDLVIAVFSLISALFTLQMMEFALIKTFDQNGDNSMYLVQLMTQGAIFIFSVVMVVLLIIKVIKKRQLNDNK